MEMMLYGLKIELVPQVYEPSEDTFLLAENLKLKDGDKVLELGTGSGVLSLVCAGKAMRVTAVDITKGAVLGAMLNARRNDIRNINVIRSDLFGALADGALFDLIIFNPPYLPEDGGAASVVWSGGPDGRAVINRFLSQVKGHLRKGGRILMIGSSLSRYEETIKAFERLGFKTRVLAKKRFFFEELAVIEAILH